MATALGITLDPDLLDRWRESFAPRLQPFRTDRPGFEAPSVGRRVEPTMDLRDTFHVYDGDWTWLEESEFVGLSLAARRALLFRRGAVGRLDQVPARARRLAESQRTDSRIVWWPSLLRRAGDRPLLTYAENGLPRSRHRELTSAAWARAERVLPGAADLAGRFPEASGPNCFGNVLAASSTAPPEWVGLAPFEAWLAERAVPIRGTHHDHRPGVVLVWRDHRGLANHAAVTIGGGYVLNKPSQGWFSPYAVWTVSETVAASRFRGVRLSRYAMQGAG